MGNAGWPAGVPEPCNVILRFNDLRNVHLAPNENNYGVVSASSAHMGVRISKELPAVLTVDRYSVFSLDLRASPEGHEEAGVRELGQLRLPLDQVVTRTKSHRGSRGGGGGAALGRNGMSIYHAWFILAPHRTGDDGGVSIPPSVDKAVWQAPRDSPTSPMVCLSLCRKSSNEAAADLYSSRASAADKTARFGALLSSQDQHAALLDSLHDELKAAGEDASQRGAACDEAIQRKRDKVRLLKDHSKTQQAEIVRLQQVLRDMDTEFARRADGLSRSCNARVAELDATLAQVTSERARLGGGNRLGAAGGPIAVVGGLPQAAEDPELSRLRGEVEATTEMANKRIDHVNSVILKLKKEIKEAQAGVREAQVQNEALAKRGREITKKDARSSAEERMKASQREQEAAKLRKEISVLSTQKQSLMDILQDVYGADIMGGGVDG